jgi:uncharacterized metal-binding protein YceD (DUF177 family)
LSEFVPEFSRRYALDTIGTTQRTESVSANAAECAALARRFALVAIKNLSATVTLRTESGAVIATGRMTGDVTQSCVASGQEVAVSINEAVLIRFVSALAPEDAPDEVELEEGDCDLVEYDGMAVDLGEAIAQSLSLALDPFPRAPGADAILKEAGILAEVEAGPFAGLKGLFGKA